MLYKRPQRNRSKQEKFGPNSQQTGESATVTLGYYRHELLRMITCKVDCSQQNKSKVIRKKAESFLVSIRQAAAAICNCELWLGVDPQISPSPGGQGPCLTQCVIGPTTVPAKWHLNPPNGLSRVRECDRRQTDRPRYGEMCSYRRNRMR